MQAILELQRQLKAVQSTKTNSAHRLNERNIVDIIRKLLDDNKVKLIYTQDGKEYLTNEQLEREIKELLIESGGRLNILEIPNHIGVNIEIVERAMDNFVKKNRVTLINGQLISDAYGDSLMEEVYELVSEKGQLMLQELTTKYGLPLDYIKECIQLRMESSLPQGCLLQGNSLMTKTFAERQVCKVRGILRGVTRPVALSAIAQQFRIEEQKLKNITDQLIKDGLINGKIQQGLFIPITFTQMQESAVKSFYNQNRYIEYGMLSKLQISKPREFIDQVIGKEKGHHLTNFYISNDLLHQIEASVHEIVENGTYLDLSHIVPSPFRDSDIQDLVGIVGAQCRLLPNDQHLCSEKFITKCLEEFKKPSEAFAIQNLKKGLKPQSEETKKPQSGASQGTKKGKGGKAGGKKGKGRLDDSDEEVKESNTEDQLSKTLQESDLKQILENSSNFPEFKDTPQRDDFFFDSLVDFLLIPANKQYSSIFMEVFARQSTKATANLNKNLEAEVEEAFQVLQFQQKQMENLKKFLTQEGKEKEYDTVSAPVKAHWCKSDCQALLNKLTMVQAFYNNVNLNNLQISKDPKTGQGSVMTAADRKTVSKQFQKHVTAVFDQLNKAITDKNFDDFMTVLSDNIKNLGARIKQLDKKIEKKVKDQVAKVLRDQVTREIIESPLLDYRVTLSKILNLRLLDCNSYLNLPNEEWAVKITTNLLLNLGVDSSLTEQYRNDLIQATQLYTLHTQAKSGAGEDLETQLKDSKETGIGLLLNIAGHKNSE